MTVYRGGFRAESLFWFVAAVTLGGLPIGVYFGTPDASLLGLILGLGLFVPLLLISMRYLGARKAFVLFPERRRLAYLDGRFSHWKGREYEFQEVDRVAYFRSPHPKGDIRVILHSGVTLVVDGLDRSRIEQMAGEISEAIGVEAEPLS